MVATRPGLSARCLARRIAILFDPNQKFRRFLMAGFGS